MSRRDGRTPDVRVRQLIASVFVVHFLAGPCFAQDAPLADYHQHLYSPAIAALISPPPPAMPIAPIDAANLIALLDAAHIQKAVVLSVAYIFGQPTRNVENEYEKVKAENDWTSAQVAQYPSRLLGFCGLNPLKDYALAELARCANDPQLRHGLKLHFGNSAIDYHDPQHIEQLRRVFRAANDYGMPIVVHLRASYSQKLAYGAEEARIFLKELAPAAPDVVIQIAHLAGGGGPADTAAQDAFRVFAEAVANGEPGTKQLYFEVSVAMTPRTTPDEAALLVRRIRQIGMQRILYGSDGAAGGNPPPREAWAAFRQLPLTSDEFRTITRNTPPYLR